MKTFKCVCQHSTGDHSLERCDTPSKLLRSNFSSLTHFSIFFPIVELRSNSKLVVINESSMCAFAFCYKHSCYIFFYLIIVTFILSSEVTNKISCYILILSKPFTSFTLFQLILVMKQLTTQYGFEMQFRKLINQKIPFTRLLWRWPLEIVYDIDIIV